MNATNNYLFKYITLYNSILFKNRGVTVSQQIEASNPHKMIYSPNQIFSLAQIQLAK
jgi:hypothetical protein